MRGCDHLAVERPSTRSVREQIPSFDRMEAAWDELMAGRPVTQRTVDTNEPIFIIIVPHFGAAYVRDVTGRVLSRTSLAPVSPVLKLRTRNRTSCVTPSVQRRTMITGRSPFTVHNLDLLRIRSLVGAYGKPPWSRPTCPASIEATSPA